MWSELRANHNKIWEIRYWPDGRVETTYGRVGKGMQTDTKQGMSMRWVESKIQEKLNKGYHEVELSVPTVVTVADTTVDSRLNELMNFVATEAGDAIKQYSAVPIDALSQSQIAMGRQILDNLRVAQDLRRQADLTEAYLNTVPTLVPFHNMRDVAAVVKWFMTDLPERYSQLDQLSANLGVTQAVKSGSTSLFAGLPIQMDVMDKSDSDYAEVSQYALSTAHAGSRVRYIFRVKIEPEREAWDTNTRGKGNVTALFHGTSAGNIQKILRTGLIIPRMAAHGSRFGRGIYFADHAQRSQNYASSRRGWKCLFIADVALGTQYVSKYDDSSLTEAPRGYDSVWGQNSYGGLDEFIVYTTMQQTIRALVVFE